MEEVAMGVSIQPEEVLGDVANDQTKIKVIVLAGDDVLYESAAHDQGTLEIIVEETP